MISSALISSKAGDRFDLPPLKGLYLFGRLFSGTVFSPQQGCALIADALFPSHYLDRPDPDAPGMTKRQSVKKEFLRRYHLARRQPFHGRIAQMSAAITHSMTKDQCRQISQDVPKITIVTGDMDSLIRPQRSLEMSKLFPGSEYVLMKGGGHALSSQMPKEINALLEKTWAEGREKSLHRST